MKTPPLLLVILALGLSSIYAQTSVPPFMNYQGNVTDGSGLPLGATGTVSDPVAAPVNRKIIFRVYDAATAGVRLWTEEQTVTISLGEFSVLLGQGISATGTAAGESRPAIDTVFTSTAGAGRFLGVTVDNGDGVINATDVEITPRQQITTAAYSFRARSADTITNGSDLQLNNSSNYGLGYYGAGRTFNGTAVDGPVLYGNAGGALGSNVNGTQNLALRWNANGQVAIGSATLASPGATTKLVLQGNDATDPPLQLTIRGDDNNQRLFMGYNTTGNYGSLQAFGQAGTSAGSASNLVLNPTGGNVGVGVNPPTAKLHVGGSLKASDLDLTGKITYPAASVGNPGNGTAGSVGTKVALWPGDANNTPYGFGIANGTLWSGVPSTAVFRWFTGVTERMSLDSAGTLDTNKIRLGTETGTSQPPDRPGLVIRRINSNSPTAGQIVAAGAPMNLERDGTNGGLRVRFHTNGNGAVVTGYGITFQGTHVPVYKLYYTDAVGAVSQIFTNAQGIGHFHLTFGEAFNAGHMTEVNFTRFHDSLGGPNDNPRWAGTVTSTIEQ